MKYRILKKSLLVLVAVVGLTSFFYAHTASASSGSFGFNVTYSKASIAWNYLDASTVTINQGEWVSLKLNTIWNLSSGCWPGADAPHCTPDYPLGQANTVVRWSQDNCPGAASCYWFARTGPTELTTTIVPNFTYSPSIQISNTGSLAPGTYPIVFKIEEYPTGCQQSGGTCIPPQTFTVNLVIQGPAPKPVLNVIPGTISFSAFSGGAAPQPNSLTVSNTGAGVLNWTASASQTWCHLSSSSGSVGAGSSFPVTVSVDAPSNVGTFSCNLTFSDPNSSNGSQTVALTYTVSSPPPPPPPSNPAAAVLTSLSPSQATLSQVQGQTYINVYGYNFESNLTCNLPIFIRLSDGQQTGIAPTGFIAGGIRVPVPANFLVGNYSFQILDCKDFVNIKSNTLPFQVLADSLKSTISLLPGTFNFSGISGGQAPAGQNLTIKNIGSSNLNWQGSPNQAWCHITPASGQVVPGASAVVSIQVDAPSNIGTFTCNISVSDPSASNNPQSILVNYSVTNPVVLSMSLVPVALQFSGISGGTTPPAQNLTINNTGNGTFNWYASTNQAWCHVGPASGMTSAGQSSIISITVDSPSNVGTFNCQVTVTGPNISNAPKSTGVTYVVSTPQVATMTLSQTSFAFKAVAGGATPPGKSLVVYNSGNIPLNWSAFPNQGWCYVSPTSGSVSSNGSQTISVGVNQPSNVGTFNCTITFSAPNTSNSPQSVSLSYTVSNTPTAIINIFPTSFSFSANLGSAAPSAQKTVLTNNGNAILNWFSSTNQSWCHTSPASGSLAPGLTTNVSISVDALNAVGTYNCTVVIAESGTPSNSQSTNLNYQVSSGIVTSPSQVLIAPSGCDVINISWQPGKNAPGYQIFRNTVNSQPALPYATLSAVTSYADTGVSVNTKYYYWVASIGASWATPADTNSTLGAQVGACQADLSPSDKNLKDINGLPQPHSDCDYNQFQGAPTSKTLRDGDILTFNINLCNLKGTSDATGVLVTDKLLNLNVPQAGFSAALDNQALVFVPNGPTPGQYAYDSSTQQLYFNVGTVPKGTARQIIYNVQVKTATANTGCVRCQSQTTVSYFKDLTSKILQTIDLYTPPIFYSVSK